MVSVRSKAIGEPVSNQSSCKSSQKDVQSLEAYFVKALPALEQQHQYIQSIAYQFPKATGLPKVLRMVAVGLWASQNSAEIKF